MIAPNSEAPTTQPAAPVESTTVVAVPSSKPPISACLNVWDLESVAMTQVNEEAWDYLNSGGDDEITFRENHLAFKRIWMRPRVLVNVEDIDTTCEMLGAPCSLPIYITGTALGRLYHEDGEMCLTRAAYEQGIVQMCPTLASCTMDEMVSAKRPGQHQWWQLYVNRDREVTRKVIKKAEDAGMEALFITVDAPQLGRRERDMRHKTEMQADVQDNQAEEVKKDEGVTRAISTFIDPGLCWDSLEWFKQTTKLPILLKGVQCAEDALMAVDYGMDGLVCSNHGGRQIDTCRSGIEILEDVMVALKARNVDLNKFHVYVDGGIRRGTDIFKCMALGAKGCGLGRPFLCGIASYGQDGAEKVVQLLRAELEMCMRLMGTPSIKDIRRDMVITRNLKDHFGEMPAASLPEANLLPMKPILSSNM